MRQLSTSITAQHLCSESIDIAGSIDALPVGRMRTRGRDGKGGQCGLCCRFTTSAALLVVRRQSDVELIDVIVSRDSSIESGPWGW